MDALTLKFPSVAIEIKAKVEDLKRRNENHPAPRLLRGPVRRRLDRQEVRLRRRCPPARDFDEDDQETSLPSHQEFCRQERFGRSCEAVTIGMFLAFPTYSPCVTCK